MNWLLVNYRFVDSTIRIHLLQWIIQIADNHSARFVRDATVSRVRCGAHRGTTRRNVIISYLPSLTSMYFLIHRSAPGSSPDSSSESSRRTKALVVGVTQMKVRSDSGSLQALPELKYGDMRRELYRHFIKTLLTPRAPYCSARTRIDLNSLLRFRTPQWFTSYRTAH